MEPLSINCLNNNEESKLTEAQLIERVKERQECAFEELIRRVQPKIIGQLKRLCKSEEEVEDILQEVLLTLYMKVDTFEGKSALSTWIYRITLNAFLMHERKQRRQSLLFVDSDLYDKYIESSSIDAEAEQPSISKVLINEFEEELSRAVSELPEGYRKVFIMRGRDDMPIKEVSKRLNISIPAVKSRHRRARQFLKRRLKGYSLN